MFNWKGNVFNVHESTKIIKTALLLYNMTTSKRVKECQLSRENNDLLRAHQCGSVDS